jgi:quercetin dioxygenase-like cupin family protein
MKTRGIGISVFIALATCVGLAAAAKGGKEATVLGPSDLKWVEGPNTGGVKTARLWGDMEKGAHGLMVTFPAATVHPLHAHSADLKIVTVSGTFRYGPPGGPEKSYVPGSYIMIPGGMKHTSGCVAGAPCVLFHEGSGKFDMKPEKEGNQP